MSQAPIAQAALVHCIMIAGPPPYSPTRPQVLWEQDHGSHTHHSIPRAWHTVHKILFEWANAPGMSKEIDPVFFCWHLLLFPVLEFESFGWKKSDFTALKIQELSSLVCRLNEIHRQANYIINTVNFQGITKILLPWAWNLPQLTSYSKFLCN